MREYLETHSVKSILSNSLCYIASIILKNNNFEKKEILLLVPSSLLQILTCLLQG